MVRLKIRYFELCQWGSEPFIPPTNWTLFAVNVVICVVQSTLKDKDRATHDLQSEIGRIEALQIADNCLSGIRDAFVLHLRMMLEQEKEMENAVGKCDARLQNGGRLVSSKSQCSHFMNHIMGTYDRCQSYNRYQSYDSCQSDHKGKFLPREYHTTVGLRILGIFLKKGFIK